MLRARPLLLHLVTVVLAAVVGLLLLMVASRLLGEGALAAGVGLTGLVASHGAVAVVARTAGGRRPTGDIVDDDDAGPDGVATGGRGGSVRADDDVQRAHEDGMAAVDAVVGRYRTMGMDVTLGVVDRRHRTELGGPLPERLWSVSERIVHEALGNTAVHAGLVATDVRVELADDAVTVRVTNPLPGQPPPPYATTGLRGLQGLRGMRERVLQVGGTLRAGPLGPDVFEVEARMQRDRLPPAGS